MQGDVFNIQRFSIHDGPGIRTTVFLKGCPLSCRWCHNPEGMRPEQELLYDAKKCISCGLCVETCPNGCHAVGGESGNHTIDRSACTACGQCVTACPSTALSLSFSRMTPEDILREVERDRPFYHEEGGLTLSGGEPLLQAAFSREILRIHREKGIATAVDTSGFVPWESLKTVLPYTDIFLYDIKAVTPERHRAGTGVDNARILDNFRRLNGEKTRIWARIPLIPGINDSEEEQERIVQWLSGRPCVERVTVMPYHTLGRNKYALVGREAPYTYSGHELESTAEELRNRLRENGMFVE